MNPRYLVAALRDQLPLARILRNARSGNLWGLFSQRSHLNASGAPKVAYGSKESASRAALKMMQKTGHYFSNYKCAFCAGYHIGKNQRATPAVLENGDETD